MSQCAGRIAWPARVAQLSRYPAHLREVLPGALNYVHQNVVKHGVVAVANDYPWCSARWFERTASAAQVKTIYRLQTHRVTVPDDFEVAPNW